ncbi:nitroreductase family deazaflavin-dependent oxidoreductase [Nocardia sp. NPDC059240]|uniref:nitroreductase family deazaflavin-dependent oxidoreductase n=1 Tax=Nocardia sp. NPDC059240 TaxID=3346786 RepID=UPI003679AB44
MAIKSDVAARLDASPHWRGARAELAPELGRFRSTHTFTWLASRAGGGIGGGGRVKLLEVMGLSGAMALCYAPLGLRVVLRSKLTRVDCELATLRTAWNARARYEWHHHVYASRFSGLSLETVERVTHGPDAPGWTPAQRLLLLAVDELCADRMISEPTSAALSQHLSHAQLVDLCMLVGHYDMLAMLLMTFGIEPEPETWRRGPLRRLRDTSTGDGITPSWLPAFNRRVTNRLARLYAGKLPPYSLIHHRGRKSGTPFTTPVVAHYDDSLLIIPLPYGTNTDWVRNILAADGGSATYRHRTVPFKNPRLVDAAGATDLPARARRYTRLVQVLVADLVTA